MRGGGSKGKVEAKETGSKEGKSEKSGRKKNKTKTSKEDDSRSSVLLKNAGVKSDNDGKIGSLLDPVPKGQLGKKKLEAIMALPLDPPKEEIHSPMYLQKIASIETGAVLDLKCENFFHFFLQEHEVWQKVRNPGEFLVRQLPMDEKERENDQDEYVICVMAKDKPLNIPINFSSARNFCYINNLSFDTPAGLVQYHYRNHIKLDDNGTRLLTPIMKDSIFINHAQIAFTNKSMVGSKYKLASIRTGLFSSISVAVSDYSNFQFEQGRLEELHKITRLAKSCNHPNILKYHGIAMSQSPAYILTEFCIQGTLGYIVRKPNGPDVGKRESYTYGLAKGLAYLEHRFILHRLISIDNIWVDGKNQVKIAEFANAVFGAKIQQRTDIVSSRHLAPEAWKEKRFSFKSDIWAFGVTLWEIFHNGRTPYEELEETAVMDQVEKGLRLKCIADKFPNKLWKMAEKCWDNCADQRPKAADIVQEMEIQIGLDLSRKEGSWINHKIEKDQRSSQGLLERIWESFALLME